MTHSRARMLCLLLLAGLTFTVIGSAFPQPACPAKSAQATPRSRIVYVAGHLADEQMLTLMTSIMASHRGGLLLMDSEKSTPENKRFLSLYHADHVVPVGWFPQGILDLEQRLGARTDPALTWRDGPPVALWNALIPRARRAVVCRAMPRSLLLEATCLAGVLRAPLCVLHDNEGDIPELARQLTAWGTRQVLAVGDARRRCAGLPGVQLVSVPDERTVVATCVRHLSEHKPIRNLVVANPADLQGDKGGMSVLAPWFALHRRAALLMTNERGDDVNAVVKNAVRRPALAHADALVLIGNLKALPMEHRSNPVPGGKDPFIEMEPLTPTGTATWSFATGRLFDDEPGQVAVRLAREQLLVEHPIERRALVVSNVGGGLPLLEAFSRNTVQELRNAGYQTTAMIGTDVTAQAIRATLPSQDIFLWEGHHSTLTRDFAVQNWPEPLQPSLVILQSCLALNDAEANPYLRRGGLGLIGSSTRIFSASGGAFTLSFFDALSYDHQTVGGALRHAKNFLLAYSLLKEKRLGNAAKLGAANVRTAWAFTLWGDPTLRLPAPPPADHALPAVHHHLRGHTIVLDVPETKQPRVVTAKYSAQIEPNGRMAGLVAKEPDDNGKQLKGLLFTEVHLPHAPAGKTPRLHTRIPSRRWVFCWDERRSTGYLLILPRPKDQGELHFYVEWTPQETVRRPAPAASAGTQQ